MTEPRFTFNVEVTGNTTERGLPEGPGDPLDRAEQYGDRIQKQIEHLLARSTSLSEVSVRVDVWDEDE